MAQTFSGRPNIILELITSSTANAASNITTISWTLQARENVSQPSWNLDLVATASVSFSVSGGGTITSTTYTFGNNISWNYDFRPTGLQTKVIGSGSFVVTHNTAGTGGTVSASSAAADGGGGLLGSADHSFTFGLSNYVRLPTTPAAPTLARSNNGTTLTITGAASTFFGSSPSYQYQTSTNGGSTWSTAATLGAGRVSTLTVTNTDTYVARTRAIDSEGTGAYSAASTESIGAPSFTGEGTDTEVANAILGTTYNDQVVALRAGSYSIFSGDLPTGLSLNTGTGAITGIPISTAVFTFSFVIRATNDTGSVETEEFTITVSVPEDGSLDTTFDNNIGTGANGSVDVILLQPDGDIVIGGQFTTVNGVTSNRIARINSDGTLDTAFSTNIGTGLDSVLKAMAIQYEKTIVIGGAFTTFNSISKPRVTRISGDITP
jgi:hypothetical protein